MEAEIPMAGADSLRGFLTALLQTVHRRTGIPGLAIAVRIADRTVVASVGRMAAHAGEMMTPGARFQIGCVAKLLTGIVVAQLVKEGILDVEAPVEYYLPELSRNSRANAIRVEHLLCHTSGYAGPGGAAVAGFVDPTATRETSWDRFAAFFRQAPQLFEPGTVFSYEHTEHVVLGEIVRRVSGSDIENHFREQVFEPLHLLAGLPGKNSAEDVVAEHEYCRSMKAWRALQPGERIAFWRASISDWTLAVADLCSLARTLLFGRNAAFGSGISAFLSAPVAAFPAMFGGGTEMELLPQSFGFGSATYRGGVTGHNGSTRGHACAVRADPVRNSTVAIALSACCPVLRDQIVERVCEYLRGERMPACKNDCVAIDPCELVGRYAGPQDTFAIVRRTDGELIAEIVRLGAGPRRIAFGVDPDGRLVKSKESPVSMIGFFRDKASGRIGLMYAMMAFRKESD